MTCHGGRRHDKAALQPANGWVLHAHGGLRLRVLPTANIAHNADAATVKARLDALTNIQALAGGTGAVTVVETGRFEWKVTFPFQNQIPFTPPAPDLTEWSLPLMTVGTSSVTSASGAVDITINKWIAGFKGTVNKVHDVQRIAMGSAWSGFNVLPSR